MSYYESIEADLQRVGEILARNTIYGGDAYAAYKLLESLRDEVVRLRHDLIVLAHLSHPEGECTCRTASCGHVASLHGVEGICVICNKPCWS